MLKGHFPDLDSKFYHARLSKEEKLAIDTWFVSSDEGVLSATCAFGMGVDIKVT